MKAQIRSNRSKAHILGLCATLTMRGLDNGSSLLLGQRLTTRLRISAFGNYSGLSGSDDALTLVSR